MQEHPNNLTTNISYLDFLDLQKFPRIDSFRNKQLSIIESGEISFSQ